MKGSISLTAQELAEACAHELYSRDAATNHLEMQMSCVSPGHAAMSMKVQPFMVQGHNTCHGGYLFTLADSAFAVACNTYNQPCVAIGCSIDYVAPGIEGDYLTAMAKERSRSGRTGNYDVEIRNQDNKLVAIFRGKSYALKGTVLPDTE
jgi:acyl-CoA thioesterase